MVAHFYTDAYTYEDGEHHDDCVSLLGLPQEHADNRVLFFGAWLLENELTSNDFIESLPCPRPTILDKYRSGQIGIHEVYCFGDRVLVSMMLTERGNAFARDYYDYRGHSSHYLEDYRILSGSLPSLFHVTYTEENYQKLRTLWTGDTAPGKSDTPPRGRGQSSRRTLAWGPPSAVR